MECSLVCNHKSYYKIKRRKGNFAVCQIQTKFREKLIRKEGFFVLKLYSEKSYVGQLVFPREGGIFFINFSVAVLN